MTVAATHARRRRVHSKTTDKGEKAMTFKKGINSKHKPKDFLKPGLKSMFPDYRKTEKATPPIDTEDGGEKRPSSE